MPATTHARATGTCPRCDTPLANVQGADVCSDCGYVGA